MPAVKPETTMTALPLVARCSTGCPRRSSRPSWTRTTSASSGPRAASLAGVASALRLSAAWTARWPLEIRQRENWKYHLSNRCLVPTMWRLWPKLGQNTWRQRTSREQRQTRIPYYQSLDPRYNSYILRILNISLIISLTTWGENVPFSGTDYLWM